MTFILNQLHELACLFSPTYHYTCELLQDQQYSILDKCLESSTGPSQLSLHMPSSPQCCVCASAASRPTLDLRLMRAITRIKRGWLEGVRERGLNNYTGLPTCLSSWVRKLQSPSFSPPHSLSAGAQKKRLMENNKLSLGHVNLDVNRWAIMF